MRRYITVTIAVFFLAFFSGYQGVKIFAESQSVDVERLEEGSVLSSEDLAEPTDTPTSTPTPTPTLTPTPSLTPTPTILPTPTLTPTSTPAPKAATYTQEQVQGFIERFAAQYGVDQHVLRHIAVCESGLNPLAENGPYAGLFQFASLTWQNNRILLGEDTGLHLRFDAEEAAQTAAFILSTRGGGVWPNCVP